MLKTEVFCQACGEHFIIVSQDDSNPTNCPFCSSPISDEPDLDMGEDE